MPYPPAGRRRGSEIFGRIVVPQSVTLKYTKYLVYDEEAFHITEEMDKKPSGPGKINYVEK